jgi:hypothetical protein
MSHDPDVSGSAQGVLTQVCEGVVVGHENYQR